MDFIGFRRHVNLVGLVRFDVCYQRAVREGGSAGLRGAGVRVSTTDIFPVVVAAVSEKGVINFVHAWRLPNFKIT